MRSKIDYSDFVKFKKQLEDLATEQYLKDITNEVGQRLYAKVVKRTPVGTKYSYKDFSNGKSKTVKVKGASGKTRSFLSKEGAMYQQYWGVYHGGTLREGWKIDSVKKIGNDYEVRVYNPVPYAMYVEYGHTQQAGKYIPAINKKLKNSWVQGQFFLTKSEIEMERQLPKIIERKISI